MIKNKKLNNKGYMLVEIILASAIAFGLAYFMIELTLKIKNKNDDLLVETLTSTDSAIISNGIMKYIKLNTKDGNIVDCSDITNIVNISSTNTSGKNVWLVKIDGKLVDEVNKYAAIGSLSCDLSNNASLPMTMHIRIPITVKQLKNKNFDVDLYYRYY